MITKKMIGEFKKLAKSAEVDEDRTGFCLLSNKGECPNSNFRCKDCQELMIRALRQYGRS